MPGMTDLLWLALGYALGARFGENVCWRSAKLNRHPGLYIRVDGKWYRVLPAP
jgi:hypothetical protein